MNFTQIIIMLIALSIFVGCSVEHSADEKMQIRQEQQLQNAQAEIGLPAIVNYQEKKLVKMIYELRDQENVVCHAYLMNAMTGEIGQYLGRCMGYGIPYSTQFSNPEKLIRNTIESYGTMPQAEPNGLFSPVGLSATWLMMIDPETNEPRPVYIEPEIIVSPFKF
jgi:hypothetical protein